MSTEKMRDTYEAWASSVLLQGKVTQEFIKVMREGDTYSLTGFSADHARKYLTGIVSAGWMAWQASRAAIEVELPDDGADDARDAGLSAETFDHGYCFALDRMVTILESLGLKVKP